MAVEARLHPHHFEKTTNAMKGERKIKRVTFHKSDANPGETLYMVVPRLNANEVIVPGSFALRFDIDLSGGHANNFLVQNVTTALVDKFTVKFLTCTLQDTTGWDIFKIFEDLW